jgi:hypothetical protein
LVDFTPVFRGISSIEPQKLLPIIQ